MSARSIDGSALARRLRATLRERAEAFVARAGRRPTLASLLVGDDGASLSYARSKARQAERTGLGFHLERLPGDASTARVVDALGALQADPALDGLIVEMPLPRGVDVGAVQAAIEPDRDADGVAPSNLGRLCSGLPGPRPATPLAVMALLEEAATPLAGAHAVVVGRSRTVGLPAALLLLARHATVTVAHSRTADLGVLCRDAEVLVVAVGRPGLVGPEAVRPGATVIDVGTTWVADDALPRGGRLVGDVDPAVAEVAGALSPVPGGVGPVTTAMLLGTTLDLAERRLTARGG